MTAVADDSPPTSPVTDGHGDRVWRCPTSFRYWQAKQEPKWRRLERAAALLGHDLFPTDEQARMVCDDLYGGDPVAERFVSEVMFGEIGHQRGRELLVQALEHGIDSAPEAPESMRALFDDFTTVPEWVDREQVELGASVWRRWGTMLFSVAGAITLEVYTEAGVATPLSLAGGYAGDNALRRFLETAKFWIDVSEPDALFTPGSAGRTTAMQVRIMHVSVRKRVGEHDEWDHDRLGLPISQTWAMLTQVGGSVAPSLALSLLGHQTTPREMRALQHFNRYMGHLLGVQPQWCPATVRECLQLLAMATAARSYDSGEHGTELIESFPRAFAPREHQKGLARLRAHYNHGIYSAYSALWMAPGTRRGYDMPSALPWALLLPLRWPLVTISELARRLPGLKQLHDRAMCAHRRNWWEFQMEGRRAEFDASSALRR